MKKYVILLFLLFGIGLIHAQSVYFGYPGEGVKLDSGDLIIVNIPNSTDGRFNESDELNKLVEFLQSNVETHYKIEINTFYGTAELSLKYSQRLKIDLDKLLMQRCEECSCEIVPKGKRNPIFLNKDSPNYRQINSRLDLSIK